MSNWIHRTTNKYLDSRDPEVADQANWLSLGHMTPYQLTGSADPGDWRVEGDNVVMAPDSERLARLRPLFFAQIDTKTDALISAGHTYADKVFSLSENARDWASNMYQLRESQALAYPVRYNTLDDMDAADLADAAAVEAFYLNGVGTIRAVLDSGTAVKDLVRAATTVGELLLVSDPR
ncbi:MAG: hypothetical protein KAJ19_18370 [Gammaproteobacteria bacterium]|nr:hypothetical protein [Gammaproteobacteria bacterium]